ncbi:MAG: LysE family translocator [Alphaproteobacteria bacterium PRO2]|nr:LysE family translocator [Alphaproteobacteria bacterium PRO2]
MPDYFTFDFFFKGFLTGLGIAAPVGPVALLCIKTTLIHGRKAGFAVGSGAGFADAFWGAVGAFSLLFVMDFLKVHFAEIRLFGGIVLILLGTSIVMKKSTTRDPEALKQIDQNLFHDFLTSFFLTVSNPATIFAFIAVFASFGIHTDGDISKALPLMTGVLCGSMSWWYMLTFSVSFFRWKISDENIHRLNIVTGVLIGLFGVGAMLSAVKIF